MSYLVLARKYRPQRFEDLVGQEHVARTLTNAIGLGRVHHAFLFTGARGVGKTSAARILARALCCVEGPTATPCGTCEFCREIVSGQSVDVLEIDGASNTGVDDVRTLREGVRYLPAKGRRKVYIIDEVHMLSTSAFNALLKTLEEPPPHVVFIFATTEVHKIPSTIMSRCQRYDFKLIPTGRLADHLSSILTTESIPFEIDGLRLVARQAAGSVRDALSLLDQVIAYVGDGALSRERVSEVLGVADRRLLFQLAEAVIARDVGSALRLVSGSIDRGIDLGQLARAFLGHLHDLEIATLVPEPADVIDATADEIAEARELAGRAPRGLLGTLFDRWARAVEEAGKSQTPRLVLEMALVDLCFAEPLLPLGDLLARLEELETRLTGGGSPSGSGSVEPPRPRAASAMPSPGPPPAAREMAPASRPSAPAEAAAPRPSAPTEAAAPRSSPAPEPPPRSPVAPPAPPVASSGGCVGGAGETIVVDTPAAVAEAWRRAREKFQDRPALSAALDNTELTEWAGARVTLTVPSKLGFDHIERYRGELEKAIGEVVGEKAQLVLKQGTTPIGGAVLRSEVAREADAAAADHKKRETEARQHPMVRKAQELFGVSPREIKTP